MVQCDQDRLVRRKWVMRRTRRRGRRCVGTRACSRGNAATKLCHSGCPGLLFYLQDTRGDDACKKIKGRKRHMVVDALGLLLALRVTTASVQDRDAALPLLKEAKRKLPSLDAAFADAAIAEK